MITIKFNFLKKSPVGLGIPHCLAPAPSPSRSEANRFGRQKAPSVSARLLLVGAEPGASAFRLSSILVYQALLGIYRLVL
jgi:hypothetical protein